MKLLLLLLAHANCVLCPKGLQIPTSRSFVQSPVVSSGSSSRPYQYVALGTAAAAAGAAASCAFRAAQHETNDTAEASSCKRSCDECSSCTTNSVSKAKKRVSYQFAKPSSVFLYPSSMYSSRHSCSNPATSSTGSSIGDTSEYLSADECSSDDESVVADNSFGVAGIDSDDEVVFHAPLECGLGGIDDGAAAKRASPPKLWNTEVHFPEGIKGPLNYDYENIIKAREWECPCKDRDSCLAPDRLRVGELVHHRKEFQLKTCVKDGKRDTMRKLLAAHYNSADRSFSRSFVVGPKNDCCAAAFAFACGVSVNTFYNARADLRLDHPFHKGRLSTRNRLQSEERNHLEAYIRELRSSMEGDKGGASTGKWHTGKRACTVRWDDYVQSRRAQALPVVGSLALFKKLWQSHNEITEYSSKAHPKCDECGLFGAMKDRLERRTDAEAVSQRKKINEAEADHDKDHRTEREYFDNMWYRGESYPKRVTCINIDAPTQWQFDLPFQRRKSRDVVKSLDGARKWQSKVTGAMVAGLGYFVYIARFALGSGTNMVLTVLVLALQKIAEGERPMGARLHVQLDNTCGENKNQTMIAFLAWLVQNDIFHEAGFFCMLKGHTYSNLDQSFSRLIDGLKSYAIYTVSALVQRVLILLSRYNVIHGCELHCLWDFKGWLEPHMNEFGGFATGKFGDGMHEFLIRKDAQGHASIHFRKSSQSSTWLPEGPGYKVWKTIPEGTPPLAQLKPDHQWERQVVEATLRQWLPHFTLAREDERVAAKAEWQQRLWGLSQDLRVEDLPDEQKLKWVELPKCKMQKACDDDSFDVAQHSSDRLENPEVNPLTAGSQRTAAMVRSEVLAVQRAKRELARATGTLSPLYQGDYLLIRLGFGNDASVQLHRIVHGLFMQDAQKGAVTFTTLEYVHTPQPDAPALWGTFHARENPNYSKHNPRSGLKFVRHAQITREHIVMYDVQTMYKNSTKELRILASSLQELARALPAEFPFPSSVPSTHQLPSAGAAAHSSAAGSAIGVGNAGGGRRGGGRRGESAGGGCGGGRGSRGGRSSASRGAGGTGGADRMGAEEVGYSAGTREADAAAVQDESKDNTDSSDEGEGAAACNSNAVAAGTAQERPAARVAAQQARSQLAAGKSAAEADSSGDEGSDSDDSYHRASLPRSDEEEACDADADRADEPPAPIPAGMARADWDRSYKSIDSFMYWACIDGSDAAWHTGFVARHLKPGRRDQYTHDARLNEERVIRGVTLTAVGYDDGLWFPIVRT